MDLLFDKIYGALIGGAIGDAMGGPVEMYHYNNIANKYNWIDSLMEYGEDISISPHGPWSKKPGSYTDDSRISKLFSKAIIAKNGPCNSGDIKKAFIKSYEQAETELEKEFLDEYYYKSIYGDKKQIFGGQPTNGGIMGIAPFGIITPCDPQKAHDDAFEAMYIVEGYSRYSASMAAAAISAAMIPRITVDGVIGEMLKAIKNHKKNVEGKRWDKTKHYQAVGLKNEDLVNKAVTIAKKYKDTDKLRDELYDTICQQFFADGSETLAIAIAMFVASNGDYKKTVEGCVNFGRDNDSSASVGGALAGAYCGINSIPSDWVNLVETVNPSPSFKSLAENITTIIIQNHAIEKKIFLNKNKLLGV